MQLFQIIQVHLQYSKSSRTEKRRIGIEGRQALKSAAFSPISAGYRSQLRQPSAVASCTISHYNIGMGEMTKT